MARMNLRTFLTSEFRKKRFINAVLKMKEDGIYQIFVDWHGNTDVGNVAHANVSFLAWHRIYIRLFELELQKADEAILPAEGNSAEGIPPLLIREILDLPYWDYLDYNSSDSSLDRGRMWRADFLGSAENSPPYEVITGSFRADKANNIYTLWPIISRSPNSIIADLMLSNFTYDPGTRPGPWLKRRLGNSNSNLPVSLEINKTIRKRVFDDNYFCYSPGDPENSTGNSHRQVLEGFFPTGAFLDPRRDSQMHNGVHMWIGGHMGSVPTAPNDPVFFLHHCNIDRLWAKWQLRHNTSPQQYPTDAEINNVRTNPGASGKLNPNAKQKAEPLIPWGNDSQNWTKPDGTVLFSTNAYSAADVLNWANMSGGLGSYDYDDVNSRSIQF